MRSAHLRRVAAIFSCVVVVAPALMLRSLCARGLATAPVIFIAPRLRDVVPPTIRAIRVLSADNPPALLTRLECRETGAPASRPDCFRLARHAVLREWREPVDDQVGCVHAGLLIPSRPAASPSSFECGSRADSCSTSLPKSRACRQPAGSCSAASRSSSASQDRP